PLSPSSKPQNAAFSPSYIPVAVFFGGTSGVGQAMAEALARQTQGRAHIIIVGRNADAAAEILAGFPRPKPTEAEDGWAHEFVACEVESMASVRTVCAALSARLKRINFLVITGCYAVGGLTFLTNALIFYLCLRYFMRYLFTRELVPLLDTAQELGQHAHVMTVLGVGFCDESEAGGIT
ncbi:hypothetical protein B0H14DRAFT_2340403, partial [Mycena olivaceomarginata]